MAVAIGFRNFIHLLSHCPTLLLLRPTYKRFTRVRTLRLVAEARNSQSLWTINGLDGTSFQLPVDETATAARRHIAHPFGRFGEVISLGSPSSAFAN